MHDINVVYAEIHFQHSLAVTDGDDDEPVCEIGVLSDRYECILYQPVI